MRQRGVGRLLREDLGELAVVPGRVGVAVEAAPRGRRPAPVVPQDRARVVDLVGEGDPKMPGSVSSARWARYRSLRSLQGALSTEARQAVAAGPHDRGDARPEAGAMSARRPSPPRSSAASCRSAAIASSSRSSPATAPSSITRPATAIRCEMYGMSPPLRRWSAWTCGVGEGLLEARPESLVHAPTLRVARRRRVPLVAPGTQRRPQSGRVRHRTARAATPPQL